MKLLLIALMLLLSACATNAKYTTGQVDISKVSTSQLLQEGGNRVYLQNTIMATGANAEEIKLMQAEVRRRHPEWRWDLIGANKIANGMTPNEVRAAWGFPHRANTHSGGYGAREQWVYNRGYGARQYVYFEDGKVSGWGDSGL